MIFKKLTTILFMPGKNWLQSNHQLCDFSQVQNPKQKKQNWIFVQCFLSTGLIANTITPSLRRKIESQKSWIIFLHSKGRAEPWLRSSGSQCHSDPTRYLQCSSARDSSEQNLCSISMVAQSSNMCCLSHHPTLWWAWQHFLMGSM